MAGETVSLRSAAATLRFGRKLGALVREGDFVALSGELGAGKTLLVRGAAQGAGVPAEEPVTSPTFALVHRYPGGRVLLLHLDLYRLRGPDDLFALGFDDLLREPAALLCEWPERAGQELPEDRLQIALEVSGPRSRRATLIARGPRASVLRDALLGAESR